MYSKLRGENNGHIFLILTIVESRQLTISPTLTTEITTPTTPTAPNLTESTTDTVYKQYNQAFTDHLFYHNTSQSLVNQIVSTIPLLNIKAVRHKITKFGNITPNELLYNLTATYDKTIVDNMTRTSST